MSGPSSAGMSNEIMAFVRAYDLVREHAGGGDDTEDIIVHEVPRAEAPRWLLQKDARGLFDRSEAVRRPVFLEHDEALFGRRIDAT